MRDPYFTRADAERVGRILGVDWTAFDVEQVRAGMDVEREHGRIDPTTDVTRDDPVLTGTIALAHLREFPDYYTRLAAMEAAAEAERSRSEGVGPEAPTPSGVYTPP